MRLTSWVSCGVHRHFILLAQMEDILRMSRSDAAVHDAGEASGSGSSHHQPNYKMRQELSARLSSIEAEIQGVDEEIERFKALRETLLRDKKRGCETVELTSWFENLQRNWY